MPSSPMRSTEPLYVPAMLLIRLRFLFCFDELLPHLQPYPHDAPARLPAPRCARRGAGGWLMMSCAKGRSIEGPWGFLPVTHPYPPPLQSLLPVWGPGQIQLSAI